MADKEKTYINKLSKKSSKSCIIDPALYQRYPVKRGLRDEHGKGILAGLTDIAEIRAYTIEEYEMVPSDGRLYYRGIDIKDITNGFLSENRFGFEETCYLLLFGDLPNKKELDNFTSLIGNLREMNHSFVRDIIMKAPSRNIMNTMARSVLALYSMDDNPDDTTPVNVLRQCLELIARFPLCAVYGYQAHRHYHKNESFFIHYPIKEYTTAQNILHMLRPDSTFSDDEAKILDLALVLHAEHGGGNNSTFTTHVITSTGTDTYSAMAAALGSLKGPKHGGANIKVIEMMQDIEKNVNDWNDDDEIKAYIAKIINKEAFDKAGLIYGMGHAVYSMSDPRSVILKKQVGKLVTEKGRDEEFKLYQKVEELAPAIIAGNRNTFKAISANVDFYSGFVYDMLNLPYELYTPIFAVSRVAGWSAHRMEELVNGSKIVRPAYKGICPLREYSYLQDR